MAVRNLVLLAVLCAVLSSVLCAGFGRNAVLRNNRFRSAGDAVRSNPTLDIRVMHYYYDGDCDPWITIIAAKCEPRFTITYSWINPEGVTQTQTQTHSGGDDVVEVSFPHNIRATQPVAAGSTASVGIAVIDDDFGTDDIIGSFYFDFDVPAQPGNYVPTTVTKHLPNGAQMSVEFTVRF